MKQLQATEISIRCACLLATLAAQLCAVYVLAQHEPNLKAWMDNAKFDIADTWARTFPKPLTGRMWDDVADALKEAKA
jgi:hypothetical protein